MNSLIDFIGMKIGNDNKLKRLSSLILPKGWNFNLSSFNTVVISVIWFLLPIKYGGSVNPTDKSTWNDTLFSWVFGDWPVFTFPIISALVLLLIILNRRGFSKKSLSFSLSIVLPGILILIASLIGWINTTEKDVAYLFSAQILAVVALVTGSIIQIHVDSLARKFILIAICTGFFLSSVSAWNQKLFLYPAIQKGFETKLEQGEEVNPDALRILKTQNRYGGSFPYANHLGAHLILLFPLYTLLAWKAKRFFKQSKLNGPLLSFSASIFMLGTLYISGSLTSAIILILIGLGLIFLIIKKHFYPKADTTLAGIRYILVFLSILIIIGFFFQENIFSDSKLLSLQHRYGTWDRAVQIFDENSLIGSGMGEFYNQNLQKMPANSEITRFAHNLFLTFLSQCGIFGGIASLTMLLYPIFLVFLVKKRKLKMQSNSLFIAVIAGSISWSLHSLLNYNIQVPATVSTFLILPCLGLWIEDDDRRIPIKDFLPIGLICIFLIGICLLPFKRFEGEKYYRVLENLIKIGASEKLIYATGERASQMLPNSPYPPSKIAHVALQLKQYEFAVNQFKESIKRTPHRSSYYVWLAHAYGRMGKIDEAFTAIGQALYWNPNNKDSKDFQSYLETL